MNRTRTALWMLASAGLVVTAGAGVSTKLAGASAQPRVVTALVTRGDLVEVVSATGTLEAVTTVTVGSQVSGIVQTLNADFNDIVRKGQVLARLDPSLFQTQVEQARANVSKSEADVERMTVALDSDRLALDRMRRLAEKKLVADADLESADVAVRSTEAQVKSSMAGVAQARANLRQADVNLANTVITAPIDGIVIARSVDAGQTVAASMQAPTLFTLAADLTRMRVNASLDESDIGRVAAGQAVTFTVDAYPEGHFTGTVAQVRLQPTVSQNVVTYVTVIDVANPKLELKPGMTATVSIETARREHALQAPASALRVTPTAEVLTLLHATPSVPIRGRVLWTYDGGQLRAVAVKTGLSNGTVTEIMSGEVTEGMTIVTSITQAATASKAAGGTTSSSASRSPLISGGPPMGPPPR